MQYNNAIVKVLGLVVSMLVFSSIAKAQDIPLLFVEDDDKSVELEVKKFLDQRTNWNVGVAYYGAQRKDAYLTIPFTLETGYETIIYIDSFSSATQSQERRLHIYGHLAIGTVLGDRKRDALLEVLNQHSIDDWMIQRLYLDNEGDIAFNWVINIPGKESPVHAEQVYDAIVRTKFSLDKLLPKLRPFGLF